jgi:hypothetical protein
VVAAGLAGTAERYGQQWTAELLRAWFGGDQPSWAAPAGRDVHRWAADRLPVLCARLHAAGGAAEPIAQRLLDLAWEQIAADIGAVLASSPPSYRRRQLGDLGQPLAAVLTAATATGAARTRAEVAAYLRQQHDAVTVLELSALRGATTAAGDRAAFCPCGVRSPGACLASAT